MKVITKYVADDNSEHNTAEAAHKRNFVARMIKYGFIECTSLKILDNWLNVSRLVNDYETKIRELNKQA
jgi:hypothetical protein